jgi:hypothetical protein
VRQLEDCADLIRVRWDELDRAYIGHWVAQLGLKEQWESAQRMAGVG